MLAVVVMSALLARTPDAPIPELTHGPLLGAVSDRSVKIWARIDRAGRFRVRYQAEGARESARYTTSGLASAESDFTAVAVLEGLRPATRYDYSLERSASGSEWEPSPTLATSRFRTLRSPGTPGKLRFVVGADIGDHDSTGLTAIEKLRPDFALLIGDNIYKVSARSLATYRERYRKGWGARRMRAMLARVPAFMMWDDHEIRDDFWPGRGHNYPDAREAYDEYQGSHNPEPLERGELYYRIVAGDVEIFVLDERSHRDPNPAPDGPQKSMLGVAQKRALLSWLSTSAAQLKVIASPVTFTRFATTGRDCWNGFAHERDEILDTITALQLPSVLLLTGDQHWNALFHFEHRYGELRQSFYELLATPLAAHRGMAPRTESPEFVARDDDANVYGVVDVDTTVTPLRIALTMCDARKRCRAGREKPPRSPFDLEGARETVPYTVVLRGVDLGPVRSQPEPIAGVH